MPVDAGWKDRVCSAWAKSRTIKISEERDRILNRCLHFRGLWPGEISPHDPGRVMAAQSLKEVRRKLPAKGGKEATYCPAESKSSPLENFLWQLLGLLVVKHALSFECVTLSTFVCPWTPCRLHHAICWVSSLIHPPPGLKLRKSSMFLVCKRVAEAQGDTVSADNKSTPLVLSKLLATLIARCYLAPFPIRAPAFSRN